MAAGRPSRLSAIHFYQHQGIWFQWKLQLSVGEVCLLRRRECGFAIQLFYLGWGRIERLAHRSVSRQHVAVFAIDSLQGEVSIGRNTPEEEFDGPRRAVLSGVDQVPCNDCQAAGGVGSDDHILRWISEPAIAELMQ